MYLRNLPSNSTLLQLTTKGWNGKKNHENLRSDTLMLYHRINEGGSLLNYYLRIIWAFKIIFIDLFFFFESNNGARNGEFPEISSGNNKKIKNNADKNYFNSSTNSLVVL